VTGNATNYINSQGDNPISSTRDEISQPSRPISPRAATGVHHLTENVVQMLVFAMQKNIWKRNYK